MAEAEAAREMQVVNGINKGAVVIYTLLTVCQVVIGAMFYWRSRRLKEINWLPKLIIALSVILEVAISLNYI